MEELSIDGYKIELKTLERISNKLLTHGKKQANQLRAIHRNKDYRKELTFMFFYEYNNVYWKDVSLILKLGKSNNKMYSSIILRTSFEKWVRLGYLTKIDKASEREKHVRYEYLRTAFVHYKMAKEDKNTGAINEFKTFYDKIRGNNDPEIQFIKKGRDLELFPNVRSMLRKISPSFDKFYFIYQWTCEPIHGGLVHFTNQDPNSEYRRTLMSLITITIEMIKINDLIINSVETVQKDFSKSTKKLIKDCEDIFEKSRSK
ncbi:MAG: hypothetical protein PHU71_01290 [Candidatus Gracilibacteria bacterium]|nr:hypothetical protein [Candidatus Gracilibacteria bacterium]